VERIFDGSTTDGHVSVANRLNLFSVYFIAKPTKEGGEEEEEEIKRRKRAIDFQRLVKSVVADNTHTLTHTTSKESKKKRKTL
jgi:hypothetical protein